MRADGRETGWFRHRLASAAAGVLSRARRGMRVVAAMVLALAAGAATAQISFVASSSPAPSSSNVTSVSIAPPAGIQGNDVLLAFIAVRGGSSNTITAPAGWTLERRVNNGTTLELAVYRRVATASEAGSYAWTFSSARAAGAIMAFRNVDTGTPIDASAQQTGSGATVTAPSVTTTVANAMLVSAWSAANGNGTFTPPGTMTERFDVATGAGPNGLALAAGTELDATAGASGTRAATYSTAATNAGLTVALRPRLLTLSGTVFEDVNYGGGAGRSRATAIAAGGSARSGARVELFDASGALVANTTTSGAGTYSFANLAPATYTVRVVNGTVTSGRTGYVAGLLPVQTFRTQAPGGVVADVTDRVGGENPARADAGNASTTLAALTTATTTAQSIASVTLTTADLTGIDFGFNFSTIVNTNDSGQGSLRQFIGNANALGGKTSLAQAGSRVDLTGSTVALPAGVETSIFSIPSGAATPGHGTAHASQLTGGVAVITIASPLPTSTQASVALDGGTQTAGVGDTNPGFAGTGGTVGTRGVVLPQVPRPEVQIVGTNSIANGLYATGASTIVRGFAIRGFGSNWASRHGDIHVAGANSLVELNVIGTNATSFTDPVSGRTGGTAVVVEAGNTTVRNNLIGWVGYIGVHLASSGTNMLVTANEIRSVDQQNSGCCGDAVGSSSSGATATVSGNLIVDTGSAGVDPVDGTYTIIDNTITASGIANTTSEPWGIWIRNGSSTASFNIINNTYGPGVNVTGGNSRLTLSQNSIYGSGTITRRNGGAVMGGLGIDLGNNGVTANNGSLTAGQPNQYMDFPVFTSVVLNGSDLTVTGYVGSAANQSAFANVTVEVFVADPDPSGHGEGRTYIGTLTTNATGGFSGTFAGVSGITANSTRLTGTATNSGGNTSEFGPNFTTLDPSSLIGGFNAFDTSTAAGAITGVIRTKVAATSFNLALVALNSTRTAVLTAYTGSVVVELLNASNNTGTLDAASGCRSSWTVIQTLPGTSTFGASDNGRINVAFSEANAWREVRVRVRTSSGTTITGCSNDAFAIRPSSFTALQAADATDSTAGTARVLANGNATTGNVHRAGRPFSVLAQAVNSASATTSGYTGAPTLSVVACTLPSGCTAGTLAATLTAASGIVSGTATYSEGGVITAQVIDATWAAVDAADSTAVEREIRSSAVTVGRFVADRYQLNATATPVLRPGLCGAGPSTQSFTFIGQPFAFGTAPVVLSTPLNAAGVAIANARPRFTGVHVTSSLTASGAAAPLTGFPVLQSVSVGAPTTTLTFSASSFSFTRDAATPVASFIPTFTFTTSVSDTTEPGATAAINSEAPLQVTPVAFASGAGRFHYGRATLRSVYGDIRREVYVPLEVQSFNGTGWVALTDVGACVAAAIDTFAYSNASGVLAASGTTPNCASRVMSTVTTSNGRANILLPRPGSSGPTAASSVTLTLNVLTPATGQTCTGSGLAVAGTVSMPWLAAPDGAGSHSANPAARVSFGRTRGETILLRERF